MPVTDDRAGLLPLFPLQAVLFPGGLLMLKVFEARYLDLVTRCLRSGSPFGVVCLRQGSEVGRAAGPVLFEPVGVQARIDEYQKRFANPFVAAERGYIDEVIQPNGTRRRICRALNMLRNKTLDNPWKKHDNIPL